MIKGYKMFLESNSEDIRDVLNRVLIGPSFSHLCKKYDAEEDYRDIQDEMTKSGWDIKRLGREFTESELLDLYKTDENGYWDIFFYKTFEILGYDKNQIKLGGEGWGNYFEEGEDYIRFSYGYHTNSYGKLLIDQIGGFDNMIERIIDYLFEFITEYIKNDLYSDLGGDHTKIPAFSVNEYVITEEGRIIVDVRGLMELFNGKGGENFQIDDIFKLFKIQLYYFEQIEGLDVVNTGEELFIFNPKFKEVFVQ